MTINSVTYGLGTFPQNDLTHLNEATVSKGCPKISSCSFEKIVASARSFYLWSRFNWFILQVSFEGKTFLTRQIRFSQFDDPEVTLCCSQGLKYFLFPVSRFNIFDGTRTDADIRARYTRRGNHHKHSQGKVNTPHNVWWVSTESRMRIEWEQANHHVQNAILRNASILATKGNFYQLCFLESLYIKIVKPCLNRPGSKPLGNWHCLHGTLLGLF